MKGISKGRNTIAGSFGIRWIIGRLYTWLTVTQVDFLLYRSFFFFFPGGREKGPVPSRFLRLYFPIPSTLNTSFLPPRLKGPRYTQHPHSARLDNDLNGINGILHFAQLSQLEFDSLSLQSVDYLIFDLARPNFRIE